MSKKNRRCELSRKLHTLGRQILYVALLALMGLPFLVHSTPGLVLEEVSFRQVVITPSGTALGGAVDLTLRSDGSYKAHFHMHDSGAIDYDFVVRAVFTTSNGTSFALQHSGHVEGTESTTLTRGPRRNSDKDIAGFHQLIRDNWPAVKAGKMSVSKDYSKAGVIGFIEDLSKTIAEITGGAARGAVGAVIALGDEMAKTFESLEQSGTISVIAGVAVIASGGGAVMAVTTGVKAGLVTKALIKNRPLTAEEYNFANVVFNGTLPPAQDIILTNLEGLGGRAFVMPGVGSKIYINIGAYGYDRPMTHVRSVDDDPGRLFIHELTHVWQIHHKKFVPGWVCAGLIAQAGNTFGDAYDYRSKGFLPWTEFNIEEQSSLVDEWFGRRQTRAASKMNPEDPTDPYFRYIRDNVRGAITAMAVTPPRTSVRNDFNNDSNADILWLNESTRQTQIWHMSASSRISRSTVTLDGKPILVQDPWRIVGSRDFNNDGSTDLLWHNRTSNETQLWFMNREARANWATVLDEGAQPIFVGPPWSIVATAPGQIIWHNSSSGETQIWRMNAHRMTGRATVLGEDGKPILVGLPWRIVSSGDFNSDGRTDILWHNSSSNETQIWLMNDRNVIGRRTVLGEDRKPMFVGLPWRIVGADDFNRDAACDILWHNKDTGESQIWFMREHSIARRATVEVRDGGGNMIGLPWRIVPTNLPPSEQAPAGSPVAPVWGFEGGWRTVTNQNGHYTLTLVITNREQMYSYLTDLLITGTFINTDGAPQYNGILRGTIPKGTRTLIYEYAQPEIKAGGKGTFTLSNDGNAITGSGTAGTATFTWNGTRAK